MESWIKIVQIVIWPVVLVILVIILRKPLGQLIQSIGSLKISAEGKKIEIELESRVKSLDERLSQKMTEKPLLAAFPKDSTPKDLLLGAKERIKTDILPYLGSFDPEEKTIAEELDALDGEIQAMPEKKLTESLLQQYYNLTATAASYFSTKAKKDA
jgi:hypothetical protein